ncbi:MAG: hypothetical protein AAF871_12760 [Pseudomonadota bacterium]
MQAFDTLCQALAAPERTLERWAPIFGGVLVLILIGILIYIIWEATSDPDILQLLGQVPIARGLITFTVTMGTIGVALAMISATFISQASDLKDRIGLANQVLTALIAVLGAIVGFYYGISDDEPDMLSATTPQVTPAALVPGGTVTIATTIGGGVVPYTVVARLEEPGSDEVIAEATFEAAGALALLTLEVPEDLDGVAELEVSVTDASGEGIETDVIDLELATPEATDTQGEAQMPTENSSSVTGKDANAAGDQTGGADQSQGGS